MRAAIAKKTKRVPEIYINVVRDYQEEYKISQEF